jgi:hypothetical protein
VPDGTGGCQRRLCIAATYPAQMVSRCIPKVVLLAWIVEAPHSIVRPLERTQAQQQLLSRNAPPLVDRGTMQAHLAMLTHVLEQAAPYELQAGRNLYEQPLRLKDPLAELTRAK